MSERRYEEVNEGTQRPATRVSQGSQGGPAAHLLHLQRLAGNAAVSQAVQSGQLAEAGITGPLPIQRIGEDEENEEEASED
jgi:hypothetical protein